MALKLTLQGALIYGAMALYLAAAVAFAARRSNTGKTLFMLGFLASAASLLYRGVHVRHVPLQNLFEVFLCLGMFIWPLSRFWRRFLGVEGEAADALLGFVVFFPAGFVMSAEPRMLPPALQSWLFVPHVAAYMVAYIILLRAGVLAVGRIFRADGSEETGQVPLEMAIYRMVRLGFPVLTLGLVLGAWWGKIAWGDYWHWDPKELWSLATWLVYAGYLHFRRMFGAKRPRVNAALVLGGSAAIIITLLWVNLARIFAGLHNYAT